jgi:hypothetical protein
MAPQSETHSHLLTFTSQERLSFPQSDLSANMVSQKHCPANLKLILIKAT